MLELNYKLKIWENTDKHTKYLNFFDVETLSYNEVIDIFKKMLSVPNEKKVMEHFLKDTLKFSEDYSSRVINFIECTDKNNGEKIPKAEETLRYLLHCIYAFAIIDDKYLHGGKYKPEDVSINEFSRLVTETNKKSNVYRGQSDYRWGVIPSMFRNYNFEHSDDCDGEYFDLAMMFEKYEKNGYLEIYNSTIDKLEKKEDISIDFLAYMQHAVAYSPLIDITTSPAIASRFALWSALEKDNKNDESAMVFKFEFSNQHRNQSNSNEQRPLKEYFKNELPRKFNVKILNKRIIPGRTMIIKDIDGTPYELDFSTLHSTIEALSPKYVTINKVYNDRMRYQKGKFILFYDYVVISDESNNEFPNGRILFQLVKDIKTTAYILSKSDKKKMSYSLSRLYPQYRKRYILKPYKWLEEQKKKNDENNS